LETQLRHQALHDALTDLPNRTLLRDRLQSEMRSADQAGASFALLFMDLDRFKDVNDTLGHHAGDQLLKEVARRLTRTMRKTDLIARLGGDEFAIVLPAMDLDTARHITEKIQKALREPLVLDSHRMDLGASMGIALYPVHGENVSALMRHADVAMYKAKRSGRAYDVYTAEHDANDPIRLSLVADLRHAIDHDELHLEYQPKVNVCSGSVEQVEALARWNHPEQGLIPPSAFIPLAEETGLIEPLTLWVLRTALKQSAAWQKAGREIGMAVNLSAHNLQDPKLVDTVAWMLRSTGVRPSTLILEITESSLMVDPEGARAVLQKLHAMGVKISIDDFGTGYSSLTYLKQLPVHEIKIDRSFVLDMMHHGTVIVRSVIDLGRNLGLEVTAEGVETQETWDALVRMGCGMVQGYHMSRPLPPAEVLAWMSEFERQTSMQSRQGNLVFVVDSNPVYQEFLEMLLRKEGFDVITASRGDDAMVALRAMTPDLILADVELPGLSGLELVRQIRGDERLRNTVIVAMAGSPKPEDQRYALSVGCTTYASKPSSNDDLVHLVRRYLAA
jgi:diguanylate cyclase (GGDEF)-like protein